MFSNIKAVAKQSKYESTRSKVSECCTMYMDVEWCSIIACPPPDKRPRVGTAEKLVLPHLCSSFTHCPQVDTSCLLVTTRVWSPSYLSAVHRQQILAWLPEPRLPSIAVSRKPVSQSGAFAISIQTFFSGGSKTFLSLGHSHRVGLSFEFFICFSSLKLSTKVACHVKSRIPLLRNHYISIFGQCMLIFSTGLVK